ncbi:hypothetical protein PLANPX_3300 [Lacipirellula parvula]|uniref:PE-PPE domain-containing protein n=1 Tax=Lacipirellula parvula TaxID=2650471 RepID=A0A5K7XAY6_9BACT|nr:hypothetical protein PLANPX_3300 [Lacipirellula parvula]
MKPIGFVAAGSPSGPRAGADATADREITGPATSTTSNAGDAYTSAFATAEDSNSSAITGWSAAAEFARNTPDRSDGGNLNFTLIGNPNRPQGGLWERMEGQQNSIPIVSFPFSGAVPSSSDSWVASKVLSEAPAMPMANLFEQIARTLLPYNGLAPQASPNDAVTISPEAQAAADALLPPS